MRDENAPERTPRVTLARVPIAATRTQDDRPLHTPRSPCAHLLLEHSRELLLSSGGLDRLDLSLCLLLHRRLVLVLFHTDERQGISSTPRHATGLDPRFEWISSKTWNNRAEDHALSIHSSGIRRIRRRN